MSFIRRRYYTWLLRAYLKRWYKAIVTAVLFGGIVFFVVAFFVNFYLFPFIEKKTNKIGYSGSYTISDIPPEVLTDVSYGLTRVKTNGSIIPGAAYKWDIKNGGRKYVFYIKRGQYFHDGRELDATDLPVSFKDVNKKIIDKYTVSFTLKSTYSPFLISVSKPILLGDLAGLGKLKIKKVDINGGFVRSLTLEDIHDASRKTIVSFYPTKTALKESYALANVDEARGVETLDMKNTNFKSWPNTRVIKTTDYGQLITLFYNNEDSNLSNKKLRQALSYAIPADLPQGQRAYSPIRPDSIYFSKSPNYGISDTEISKSLMSDNADAKKITYEITTTDEFVNVAKMVSASWEKIGIRSKIKVVTELPHNFQILIYPIKLPADPDQYTLWHSKGENNISNFKKNQRIDKLLEDGRSTTDTEQRISIYADFQKYLIDEAPATFLYFPQTYTVQRK